VRARVQAHLRDSRASGVRESEQQHKRLPGLQRQKTKARDAYYADATSLEDFRTEQRRLDRDIHAATQAIERCEATDRAVDTHIEQALTLCANARGLYLAAPPATRRMLNQALFREISVRNDKIGGYQRTATPPHRHLRRPARHDSHHHHTDQCQREPDPHSRKP
jgi:hypothetical protein